MLHCYKVTMLHNGTSFLLLLQPNSILENKEYIAQNADSIGHPAEAHLLNNVYFLSSFALFSERICNFAP